MKSHLDYLNKPRVKILNESKPSKCTLQEMLSQPYLPPTMVFEKQIEKPKPKP